MLVVVLVEILEIRLQPILLAQEAAAMVALLPLMAITALQTLAGAGAEAVIPHLKKVAQAVLAS
jgi:hypothetical protein